MRVAIIGGGITGVSVGYFLAREGVSVEIFEASPALGGLAGRITLDDGTSVDRFYHAILSSDTNVRALCDELGIADQLRFRETRTGFYHQGQIHPMNGTLDFLRFPLLGWWDRFRLGLTVLRAQFVRDWEDLEGISVRDWLVYWSGRRVYEDVWRPMLNAKFDGGFESIPATYIWSRLVRMKSARNGALQRELVGHLIGGHITLIDVMAAKILEAGGVVHLNMPAQEIMIDEDRAWGLRFGMTAQAFDAVVCTLPIPLCERLIPEAEASYRDLLGETEYLGVVSALLALERPLSGYWTLNIADDDFPFTGVIETTTYIDPEYVGGHHLVYLPKYFVPESELQRTSDDEIERLWLENLGAMFPDFDRSWIRYLRIHRSRYVEPLHRLNGSSLIPSIESPIGNLYLATTAQIYPGLTNAESLTQHALEAAEVVLERRTRPAPEAAGSIARKMTGKRVLVENS